MVQQGNQSGSLWEIQLDSHLDSLLVNHSVSLSGLRSESLLVSP